MPTPDPKSYLGTLDNNAAAPLDLLYAFGGTLSGITCAFPENEDPGGGAITSRVMNSVHFIVVSSAARALAHACFVRSVRYAISGL